jgi:hypothetical protein
MTAMPRSKKDLVREIAASRETVDAINEHIKDLQEQLRKARPNEPRLPRITVTVRFGPQSKKYEFLLLRIPSGRWLATGTSAGAQEFENWKAVLEWLNGPAVYSYDEFCLLLKGGQIV